MGLSAGIDHDAEESAMSLPPERLRVGVIMYDWGPIAASGEMVVMPKDREGVMVPMGVCPGMFMGNMSYSLGRPSKLFFMGVSGNGSNPICSDSDLMEGLKYSGSCLAGPGKYFCIEFEGGVMSRLWLAAKAPSRSKANSLGVERLEVLGVKTSYADDAEEKLVVVEGHDMDWLHMLKPSSMSNLKSDSNCILTGQESKKTP